MFKEHEIYETLKGIGVQSNLIGHDALIHAIMIVGNTGTKLSMTKEVYPQVAEIIGSTPSRVERCIRNAVEKVFENTSVSVLNEYFGNTINCSSGKLTNSEFIYGVVNYMKHHQ